jgi:hypothetical protein
MSAGNFLSRAWNKTAEEAKATMSAVGDSVVKAGASAADAAESIATAEAKAVYAAKDAAVAAESTAITITKTLASTATAEEAHLHSLVKGAVVTGGAKLLATADGMAKKEASFVSSASKVTGAIADKAFSYAKSAVAITDGVFHGLTPTQKITITLKAAFVLAQTPQLGMALLAQKILRSAAQTFAPNPASTVISKCTQAPAIKLASIIDLEKKLIAKAGPATMQSAATQKAVAAAQVNVDAGVRALMSDEAYSNTPVAGIGLTYIPGFRRLNEQDMRNMSLDPELFNDPDLHAALYVSTDGTYPPHYTLAFRGTDNQPDVITDIRHGMSISTAAYEKAQNLGMKVMNSVAQGGGTMDLTGHSLGGGLAQAVSAETGLTGTTFNASGLDPKSVKVYDKAALDRDMVSYHVDGEPLTEAQHLLVGIPAAAGKSVQTPAPLNTALIDLHKIPAVETSQAITNLQTMSALQSLVGPP